FSSRRRHTRSYGDWSSDVCSSDLRVGRVEDARQITRRGALAISSPSSRCKLFGTASDARAARRVVQRVCQCELLDSIRSETRRVPARRVVRRHYHREKYSARPCEYWRHFLEKQSAEDRICHLHSIARDAIDPTGRCCAAGNDNSRSRASSW